MNEVANESIIEVITDLRKKAFLFPFQYAVTRAKNDFESAERSYVFWKEKEDLARRRSVINGIRLTPENHHSLIRNIKRHRKTAEADMKWAGSKLEEAKKALSRVEMML